MERYSGKDEICPRFLDLIPRGRDQWLVKRAGERSHGCASEEQKLELRLGPPGEDWGVEGDGPKHNSSRERGHLSPLAGNNGIHCRNITNTSGAKRGFIDTVDRKMMEGSWIMSSSGSGPAQKQFSSLENPVGVPATSSSPWSSSSSAPFLQLQQQSVNNHHPQSLSVMGKEQSRPCCTKVVDLQQQQQQQDAAAVEKAKAFSISPASATNTAVPNNSCSQKRRPAPAPVVGWPPIRSFRKNLASSSSSPKPTPESSKNVVVPSKVASEKQVASCRKGLFVKINMDGVPIGRKVDLTAYDSYEKLSYAVDELFRGLLAAQNDSSVGEMQNNQEGKKAITGLLDGSGEYTLVYEDNEGDRMLVGDVPWHMFVSGVKRLRVLKSSELSTLNLGSKQEKIPLDAGMR